MKRITLLTLAALALISAVFVNANRAQAVEEFPLWPELAPGEKPDATKQTYEYWAP